MTWESNGASTSVMPNGTRSLAAAIDPYYSALNLPAESILAFLNATGTYWTKDGYGLYNSSAPPVGNLIITLSDGQRTTIPAEDLYQFPAGFNEQGVAEAVSKTTQILLMTEKIEGVPNRLGLPFLTQKYFVSDYDQDAFYMAVADKSFSGTSARSLKPLVSHLLFP